MISNLYESYEKLDYLQHKLFVSQVIEIEDYNERLEMIAKKSKLSKIDNWLLI